MNAQLEKLQEQLDQQMSYMWEEYELTYSSPKPIYDPNVSRSCKEDDFGDKDQDQGTGRCECQYH